MQPTDPHEVLLAHDRWANAQMYDACRALTPDQFHHTFKMGTGSIHNNLAHNLGAMRGWTDLLADRDARYQLEEDRYSLDQLVGLEDSIATEFASVALSRPFNDVLTPTRNGVTYRFTVGGILTHVLTHSVHHRAQCCNMLRQLGIESQPMSSIYEWMMNTDA